MILQTRTLFISAGHSNTDPGAAANGATEADVVLGFRDALADELRGKVAFATDGEAGSNLPLRQAAKLVGKDPATLHRWKTTNPHLYRAVMEYAARQ